MTIEIDKNAHKLKMSSKKNFFIPRGVVCLVELKVFL